MKSHLTLSHNILKYLNCTPIYFYEQARQQTNFTVSLQPLNSILAILKNILKEKERINKIQDFSQ
jgi:hypothetical protein